MSPIRQYHSWIEAANADNAAATATRSAGSGARKHYITSIAASYDTSGVSGTLTLSDGATEIGRWFVHDALAIVFPSPLEVSPASAAELELSASGTGGQFGAVTLTGYTL